MNASPRRVLTLTAIVALAGAASWLGYRRFGRSEEAQRPPNLYSGLITIGAETWPGYLALFIAQDRGYFQEEGLRVRVKRYSALGTLSKDYVAGKMQARANLTLDAVNERLQGLDHQAVLAIDYSNGADAIAARRHIRGVKDFIGKRVAYEPDTLEEFFLSWALNQYNLSLRDVISVPGNPEETGRMLESGQVDVAVTHEPFLSKAIKSGKARAIYSSANAPGLITDILTFRTDFIERHPESVHGVLRAYFKGLEFWKEHPEEAYIILGREFGEAPEIVRNGMLGITMLDLRDNRTAFSFAAGLKSLYGNMRRIGEFVQAHRKRPDIETLETDTLIEARFIRDLFRERERSREE